jgi:hypothetical protein
MGNATWASSLDAKRPWPPIQAFGTGVSARGILLPSRKKRGTGHEIQEKWKNLAFLLPRLGLTGSSYI